MSLVKRIQSHINKFKPFPRISKYLPKGDLQITHVSAFTYGNAGDILLPVVLQDLFNEKIGVKKWKNKHVFTVINSKIINRFNHSDALLIGGGGLFLKDTNPNNLSGWQWSCSIGNLKKIESPIIMFAVGYNRFRGQQEFEPIFTEHLNEFVAKAKFIGIRNHGSIEKLKTYLKSEELKDKLVFQPCMTTLISKIYPSFCDYNSKQDFIAFNCAFDRENLRIESDKILKSIAKVALELSKTTEIRYYSHMVSDLKILPYFDELKVPYKLVEFSSPKQIIEEYSKPKLVIGMRGHAQMIPFGCNTPILSIISHDKLQWFLNDINHPEWGVDVVDNEFEKKLLQKSLINYSNFQVKIAEIKEEQDKLWQISLKNLQRIDTILKAHRD